MKNSVIYNNGNPYDDPAKYNKESRIPKWLSVIILKYWAAGAAIFFIGMGGSFIHLDYSQLDINNVEQVFAYYERFSVLLALFLAVIMNYIVKRIIHMMHTSRNSTKKYCMINKKGFLGFILNLLYAFLTLIPIMAINVLIAKNGYMKSFFGSSWGVEPFSMGLMYISFDYLFILIKNSIIKFIQKRRFTKEAKINEEL